MKEVVYAVFTMQQRKIKQAKSMKNTSVENQSPLEKSRNEQVQIKNEILKKEWAPISVMEASLAVHNAQCRTMAIAVKPQLRQKFGELISMEALAEVEEFFSGIMNRIAVLELDEEYLKEAIEDQKDD